MQLTNPEIVARHVAAILLEVGAVQLRPRQPFTWASGIKSPIYCDNRLMLSYPSARTFVKSALAARIRQVYPDVEAIAGVATAGIPQGALVADVLNLPFLYVRAKPKEHGMTNLIEGKIVPGQQVVVIEDLISTGGSSLRSAEALRLAKLNVLGMVAIFTYEFTTAISNFYDAGISLHCLSDYTSLLAEALQKRYISADELASLQAWRKDPENWFRNE